jgi:GTP-binding protein EngB required for normal cell division
MSDAITVVEDLDFIVSLAAGHLHPDDIAAAQATATNARLRAGHLGTTMVLALLGGTGSGKSSLLNALADEEIASTSPVRPHTTEPLALIPSRPEPSLRALLDRLGITRIVTQDRFPDFAILDMTDVDSVAVEHRHQVQRLLPEVDVVLWVLDPVKYGDTALHRDFIAPLASMSDRVVFILNKVDQVEGSDLDRIVEHLRELLLADGIAEPILFETAAAPPSGPTRGIDGLAAHLSARLDEKRIHIGKIVDDARRAALSVAGAAGVSRGGSLDFETRWEVVRAAIATEMAAGGGAAAFEEALRLVEGMILRLSTDAGGVFGVRIRQSFSTRVIEAELGAAFETASHAPDPAAELEVELQERFGATLRAMLWERASLSAVVAGLSVDATMVDQALGRSTT